MKIGLFVFSKKQHLAILVLVCMIVILQTVLFMVKYRRDDFLESDVKIDKAIQQKIDSLKQIVQSEYLLKPFNPNYISDAKGFSLGMTTEEIDRLLKFRNSGQYVNSPADFQRVTKVSNEFLLKISPYFKFPEWTQSTKSNGKGAEKIIQKTIDLNKATVNDLLGIKGIGDYYAALIVSEREKLNGFVSMDQLAFIKGLRVEAREVLKQNTFIKTSSPIKKVNVNTASKEELEQIPYVNYYIAREIVILRSKEEKALKIEDLEKINNFPLDKLKIIRLYLDF